MFKIHLKKIKNYFLFLFFCSKIALSYPVSVNDPSLDLSQLKTDFSIDLIFSTNKLNESLDRLNSEYANAIRNYLRINQEFIVNPKPVSIKKLDFIYCSGTFNRNNFLPNRLKQGLHKCVDSETGLLVSENAFDQNFRGRKLADFLYHLNKNTDVKFKTWQALQLTNLIISHLDKNMQIIEYSDSQEVVYESISTWKGAVFIPKIRFNPQLVEAYLETKLLPIFKKNEAWSEYNTKVLTNKTVNITNGITYNEENIAVDAVVPASPFPLNAILGNGYPSVIQEVTCRGTCVAIEKSDFVESIGTYTYAWQILFYSSVWPNFNKRGGYCELSGVNQPSWFIWFDMIAGNDDKDTLRNSTFFRRQFELVSISGAIR